MRTFSSVFCAAAISGCLFLCAACSEPPEEQPTGPDYSQAQGRPRADLVPKEGSFQLLFQDDFDHFDEARWSRGTHTFTENDAQFSEEMVTIENGLLKISLAHADGRSSEGRPYLGGEVRTNETFIYGRFETRAKFARGSGVVSSLFTFYDHWSDPELEEDWNEIDIEVLGGFPDSVHFNLILLSEADFRKTYEAPLGVEFDPTADFHEYAIEWLPHVVHFYVDGELVHSQTEDVSELLRRPSKLMMNVWAVKDTPGLNNWAGKLEPSALPTAAYYDWVRVSAYVE